MSTLDLRSIKRSNKDKSKTSTGNFDPTGGDDNPKAVDGIGRLQNAAGRSLQGGNAKLQGSDSLTENAQPATGDVPLNQKSTKKPVKKGSGIKGWLQSKKLV